MATPGKFDEGLHNRAPSGQFDVKVGDEAPGGTDLLVVDEPAPDEARQPSPQDLHDTLHSLPSYTQVKVTFSDGDGWEGTSTLLARGLPTTNRGDGLHTRRFTNLTSGTEMFIDSEVSSVAPHVSNIEIDEDSLPKCELCKTNPVMGSSVCDECRGPDECRTCGTDISGDDATTPTMSYEGECLDCADQRALGH